MKKSRTNYRIFDKKENRGRRRAEISIKLYYKPLLLNLILLLDNISIFFFYKCLRKLSILNLTQVQVFIEG